jgi:2,3-bisphosphoglycerate-independent phosphoglycerate mutase
MIDSKGKPQTAHSMNKVPFLLMNKEGSLPVRKEGKLGDIAPTLLALWKQEKPAEMDGQSLLTMGNV